ncbi:MAG TPA: ATP-binding protein [Ignavibacteria bacterium]|mgnify:CR=1 FL=1|nr:ATP-binding protein [Ignavibacteria bacterium]
MFHFEKKDIFRFKVLGILSLILLFVILFVFGVRYYFSRSIISNWESISAEKKLEIQADCLNIFYNSQNQTAQYSYQLLKNKRLVQAVTQLNTRKAYDALYESEINSEYNIEIYNSRLELFMYSGRQSFPDVIELKKALSGERYSIVKENGIFTYIMVFDPVKNDNGGIEGVLVTTKIIDVNSGVQSSFFNSTGLRKEIYDRFHLDVQLEFNSPANTSPSPDTSSGSVSLLNLKGIHGSIIGKMFIPELDQSSYLLSILGKFDNVIGFIGFILNAVLIYWLLLALSKADSYFLRISLFAVVLIVSRYLWLHIDFPGEFFGLFGSDLFSPVHYASGIGFGMAKSLGELSVSSVIFTVISVYILINVIKLYKSDQKKYKWYYSLAISLASVFVSLIVLNYYGLVIQSLIFDSSVKFIDKSDLFSFNQPELIVISIIILFLSISLVMIFLAAALVTAKYTANYLGFNRFLRKNTVIAFFVVSLLFNLIISLFPDQFLDVSLKLNLRLTILALTAIFSIYIQRQLSFTRDYKFVNIINLSLILLVCAVFIPAVLLNKITSLENRYLEKAAKDVSQQSTDKIVFLLSATIDDIGDDTSIETGIKDKNKAGKLAFDIWSRSKFFDEDLNSAIYVLDTAKKLISDFNINPGELVSDSVLNFTLRTIKTKKVQNNPQAESETETEEEPETLDINAVMNTMLADEVEILQNADMKFYSALIPLERSDLKNSPFNKVIGYVVIAAGYDAKNFLTQTNLGIFRSFARDNILNKLTSTPVISEFAESEIVGSSNKDISKAFLKSLDAFRESVKDKIDKSALRYDEFENEIYKSFYVLTESRITGNASSPKIYVVSVKVNDFSLSTFFFFRYLLFLVLIYLIFLFIYIVYKGFSYLLDTESVRFIKFGFREKLFASFMLASVIPIVILAIYTRAFVNEKNEDFYKNQLISDLRIVDQYVRSRTGFENSNTDKRNQRESISGFSNLFDKGFSETDKNFNFYIRNRLAATTSEQLYKSDLLDTRLSGNAYYNLALLKKDYFSENQQIGDFTFIVGYKPIYDNFNNLTGIISTQTVFKQSEINQELTESLVYILGPYFAAVILLIFIVNFLSYRISNPILRLQKATEQLSQGNIDVQVRSNSKDEIGELVQSFNRMIKELKRSREELKKAEREGAWRDIARQVAHEIKNPLTPMKLAMQHLYYAYTHGSNDFRSIIQTTNKLIIDQVETLNRIATEFSNFAKLPSRNYELLNMNEILEDVVRLMDTGGKISLKLDPLVDKEMVMGDKDEVKRALINIIKNSMQAIDELEDTSKSGKVNVESLRKNGFYSVKIRDNGVGMDDDTQQKLFEPYFSTKSSGMGLGLVITKKILDDMKAHIKVNSSRSAGTEVEINFRITGNRVQ